MREAGRARGLQSLKRHSNASFVTNQSTKKYFFLTFYFNSWLCRRLWNQVRRWQSLNASKCDDDDKELRYDFVFRFRFHNFTHLLDRRRWPTAISNRHFRLEKNPIPSIDNKQSRNRMKNQLSWSCSLFGIWQRRLARKCVEANRTDWMRYRNIKLNCISQKNRNCHENIQCDLDSWTKICFKLHLMFMKKSNIMCSAFPSWIRV